jgi:hypothetical protein
MILTPLPQWIVGETSNEHDLSTDFRANFSATRKWRSATQTIMAANRLRSGTSSASSSSGTPPTPTRKAEGPLDSDSDAVAYHTAEEQEGVARHSPMPIKRSDESGAHGQRMDVEHTPEERRRRAEIAREEEEELKQLKEKTDAVEI